MGLVDDDKVEVADAEVGLMAVRFVDQQTRFMLVRGALVEDWLQVDYLVVVRQFERLGYDAERLDAREVYIHRNVHQVPLSVVHLIAGLMQRSVLSGKLYFLQLILGHV